MLIIGGSGSGKTNSLFNLINEEPNINKIYLYTKDPSGAKYQFSINKRESTGLKNFNDSKAIIENSNYMMTFITILKNLKKLKHIWMKSWWKSRSGKSSCDNTFFRTSVNQLIPALSSNEWNIILLIIHWHLYIDYLYILYYLRL